MAKHNKYSFAKISKALETYRNKGAGRWMTTTEYDAFKKCVYKEHMNHHQGEETDNKRYKVLFFSPCRICGQPDHPMLCPYINEDGNVTYHYSCPVAAYDNWNQAYYCEDKSMKYDIDIRKFAQEHHFCYNSINEALETCRVYGTGKYMDIETFRVLRQMIIHTYAPNRQEVQSKRFGSLKHIVVIAILTITFGMNLTLTQRRS